MCLKGVYCITVYVSLSKYKVYSIEYINVSKGCILYNSICFLEQMQPSIFAAVSPDCGHKNRNCCEIVAAPVVYHH